MCMYLEAAIGCLMIDASDRILVTNCADAIIWISHSLAGMCLAGIFTLLYNTQQNFLSSLPFVRKARSSRAQAGSHELDGT